MSSNAPAATAPTWPWSTTSCTPLMPLAAPLFRNTSGYAISSGVRCSVPAAARNSVPNPSHTSALARARGVSVGPGMIELMRMPCFMSGIAWRPTYAFIACLANM